MAARSRNDVTSTCCETIAWCARSGIARAPYRSQAPPPERAINSVVVKAATTLFYCLESGAAQGGAMQGAELRMFVGALVLMTTVLGVLVGIGSSPAAMLQRSEPATSWVSSVRAVDEALQRDDVSAAVRAWRDAYGIALASRRWEAMIDVGDAFLRVSATDRSRDGGK